jgi:hypothetical protein
MDFYEVLDQIIALLRQRGRVSYQALKRQFDVDDAYLEDLKVELIEVQELARDHDGKRLVEPGRNYPSLYTVNGRPLYVHLNGLAIVLLK